jgi:hypothetical protein
VLVLLLDIMRNTEYWPIFFVFMWNLSRRWRQISLANFLQSLGMEPPPESDHGEKSSKSEPHEVKVYLMSILFNTQLMQHCPKCMVEFQERTTREGVLACLLDLRYKHQPLNQEVLNNARRWLQKETLTQMLE